jgi:hypothetical protein
MVACHLLQELHWKLGKNLDNILSEVIFWIPTIKSSRKSVVLLISWQSTNSKIAPRHRFHFCCTSTTKELKDSPSRT